MDIRRININTDMEKLRDFFRIVFDHETDLDTWLWKYQPPWAKDLYTWAAFKGERLLVHFGAVPLRGQVNGRNVPFFLLGDIAVHPDYRAPIGFLTKGPKILFDEIQRVHPELIFYGFTGRRAALWYQRLGGAIAEHTNDRMLQLDAMASSNENLELKTLPWNTEAIDPLWEQIKPPTGIIRDRAYLNWRYVRFPAYEHQLIGVFAGGELMGWMIVADGCFDDEPLDELRILDYLLPTDLMEESLRLIGLKAHARALVFWCPEKLWTGESRDNSWVLVCQSGARDIGSAELGAALHYRLGEADEWWR